MSKLKSEDASINIGCFLVLYFLFSALIALWTDRNLDYWTSYFKEKPVEVPYYVSFAVTVFVPPIIAANLVGELGRYAVE